jgi:hypothetical protein
MWLMLLYICAAKGIMLRSSVSSSLGREMYPPLEHVQLGRKEGESVKANAPLDAAMEYIKGLDQPAAPIAHEVDESSLEDNVDQVIMRVRASAPLFHLQAAIRCALTYIK